MPGIPGWHREVLEDGTVCWRRGPWCATNRCFARYRRAGCRWLLVGPSCMVHYAQLADCYGHVQREENAEAERRNSSGYNESACAPELES